MSDKKETVGKISSELLAKTDYYDKSTTVIDQRREMQKDFEDNVRQAVGRGLKMFNHDFYVVVETKKERLMHNVIRNYFFPRSTCPTPTTDQIVYHYHYKDQRIDFLWVLPSEDTCKFMRDYPLDILEEEKELLNYILMFYSGDLLKLAKKLNGEKKDSPLLEEAYV